MRRRLREWRRSIHGSLRAELAVAAADRALSTISVLRGESVSVGTYLPDDGELDTGPLGTAIREAGGTLWLPVLGDDRLRFAVWEPGAPLRPNRFGIGEPGGPAVEADALDLIIVPVVAVDTRGCRLGRGGGWYDRTLARLDDRPTTVGYAFDEQVVERIDDAPWDVALDAVVTPTRRFGAVAA